MRTASLLSASALAAAATARAPLRTPKDAEVIEGKYIVMMKPSAQISSAVNSIASDADLVYEKLGGFSATLTDEEVEALREDPNVKYIEKDVRAQLFDVQEDAPWGLARLSNTEPGSSTYTYDAAGGEGVCAYIIDTGIDVDHEDFEGRAEFIATFVDDIMIDDQGHGTHCAGTVGGAVYGVAKKSTLYGIKIFDSGGFGTGALMVAGMNKVIEDAPTRDCPNGVVINMSFGISQTQSVNDAAAALADAGYFAVVAAGNGVFGVPVDAAGYSPAGEPSICTVGATAIDDTVASFSNFGEVVDIYAPGVDVESAVPGGGVEPKSGTSMAAPHVAGLGAYFMSLGQSASGMCEYLAGIGLEGVIDGVPEGTKNILAQNGQA